MARVACSQTTSPRGSTLCQHFSAPGTTRNLSRFEKSQAECDELGAVSAAPPRTVFESLAKDLRARRYVPERMDAVFGTLAPSQLLCLAKSTLDGQRGAGHHGCVSSSGMGEKCWRGHLAAAFLVDTHGRLWQEIRGLCFARPAGFRTSWNQETLLGATEEDGVRAAFGAEGKSWGRRHPAGFPQRRAHI